MYSAIGSSFIYFFIIVFAFFNRIKEGQSKQRRVDFGEVGKKIKCNYVKGTKRCGF